MTTKTRNKTSNTSKKGKAVKDASNIGKLKTFTYYDDDGNAHKDGSLDLLKSYMDKGSELNNVQTEYEQARDNLKTKRTGFANIMVGAAAKMQQGYSMSDATKRKACAKAYADTMRKFFKDNFGNANKPAYFSQTTSNCKKAIELGIDIKQHCTAGQLNKELNVQRKAQKEAAPESVRGACDGLLSAFAEFKRQCTDKGLDVSETETALINSIAENTKQVKEQADKLAKLQKKTTTTKAQAAAKAATQVEGETATKARGSTAKRRGNRRKAA